MPLIPRRRIDSQALANFLKKEIEPLSDFIYGNRYRAAARLLDGTYLPCVVFQSKSAQLDLALRRFDELRSKPDQYRTVVETFVAGGSRIAEYEIKSVEASPYAWPLAILRQIHGETVMSWTAFVVEMKDGSMHSYGTSYNFEFFDLPDGYSFRDITAVHSGMVYSTERRMIEPFSVSPQDSVQTYREKPFLTCYLSQL